MGKFREKSSGYVPKAGDIIFFVGDPGYISKHTGIVTNCDGTYVYTVEGNSGSSGTTPYWKGSRVTKNSYLLTSSSILGYFES